MYRALLSAILERGYARADRHAARYLMRLRAIATERSLEPLATHAGYEAELRQRHARKSSFWSQVKAAEQRVSAGSEEDDSE